jgi:hypothetical protein
MKAWTRTRILVAGIVLLGATNAIVLAGAAYNRSGDPEAVLRMSHRELIVPAVWGFESENSGVSLQIQWRLPRPSKDEWLALYNYGYAAVGGEAIWLDKAKLVELGFDMSRPAYTAEGGRYYDKQLPKEVLLVLELDGQAYRSVLQATEEHAMRAQARFAANPGVAELKDTADAASKLLAREQSVNSRLFVVDAGHDRPALRAKYPDRSHYAIVPGRIRITTNRYGANSGPVGYVSDLSVERVNVPATYRGLFESILRQRPTDRPELGPRYDVKLAFGKRLEPWLVEARLSIDR